MLEYQTIASSDTGEIEERTDRQQSCVDSDHRNNEEPCTIYMNSGSFSVCEEYASDLSKNGVH